MTKAEEVCRMIGIVLTNRQKFACEQLEKRGLQFCVHFGYQNCEQKAADFWVNDLQLAEAMTAVQGKLRRFSR